MKVAQYNENPRAAGSTAEAKQLQSHWRVEVLRWSTSIRACELSLESNERYLRLLRFGPPWVASNVAGAIGLLIFSTPTILGVLDTGLLAIVIMLIGYATGYVGSHWILRDRMNETDDNRRSIRVDAVSRSRKALDYSRRMLAEATKMEAWYRGEAERLFYEEFLRQGRANQRRAEEFARQKVSEERTRKRLRLQALLSLEPSHMDGTTFEQYVAEVYEILGMQVEHVGGRGDQGVDLVAASAGFRWAIQVKRYSGPVNHYAVQEVFAGRVVYQCDRAMVVTNSRFTRAAVRLSESTGVALVDGETLRKFIRIGIDQLPYA